MLRHMEITEAQYIRIESSLPRQRGNVTLSNLQLLNALLYVAEQGCKWRGLPKRFGNWHTIYTRMNRWSKNGVLDRVFEQLQREQIVRVQITAVKLDSTIVKVHPDGTGALKKTAPKPSASPAPNRIWQLSARASIGSTKDRFGRTLDNSSTCWKRGPKYRLFKWWTRR